MLKMFFAVTLLFFATLAAEARTDLSYQRSGGADSVSHHVSVGFSIDTWVNPDTEVVGLNHYLNYNYSSSKNQVNLNPAANDFDITATTHDLSYSLFIFEHLTLGGQYSLTQHNNSEALTTQYSGSLYYQFTSLQLGIISSTSQSKENKDVIVLNQNIRDQIKFNQKSITYYVDYQWSDSILTKLSHTTHHYDENLNSFNTLLTSTVFLDRAGPSMAYEVQSQIEYSTDFDLLYSFNDNWSSDLGLSQSKDQISPYTHVNAASVNVRYEAQLKPLSTQKYSVDGTIYYSKADDDSAAAVSAAFGIGYSF